MGLELYKFFDLNIDSESEVTFHNKCLAFYITSMKYISTVYMKSLKKSILKKSIEKTTQK